MKVPVRPTPALEMIKLCLVQTGYDCLFSPAMNDKWTLLLIIFCGLINVLDKVHQVRRLIRDSFIRPCCEVEMPDQTLLLVLLVKINKDFFGVKMSLPTMLQTV